MKPWFLLAVLGLVVPVPGEPVLDASALRRYAEAFAEADEETVQQAVPNEAARDWLEVSVPRFSCPDRDLEEIYWFRWWTFRKHLRKTTDGWIVTEFLPDVPWAGKHNSINCPAGHHFREGRWIRNPEYLDDYGVFWFRKGGEPRKYSFWAADAINARGLW